MPVRSTTLPLASAWDSVLSKYPILKGYRDSLHSWICPPPVKLFLLSKGVYVSGIIIINHTLGSNLVPTLQDLDSKKQMFFYDKKEILNLK